MKDAQVEDDSSSGTVGRRGRCRLGLRPATAVPGVLRAAHLQGPTGQELGIDAEDTFIYIRGYPSKDERDKRLKAAHDDPEFGEVVLKQERDPNARLIIKAHNIDMVPSGSYTAIKVTD